MRCDPEAPFVGLLDEGAVDGGRHVIRAAGDVDLDEGRFLVRVGVDPCPSFLCRLQIPDGSGRRDTLGHDRAFHCSCSSRSLTASGRSSRPVPRTTTVVTP